MSKEQTDKTQLKVTSVGAKNPPRMGSTVLQKGGDGLYTSKADKLGGPLKLDTQGDRERKR